MKIQLDHAEYQVLNKAEHSPAWAHNVEHIVSSLVSQGLATRHNEPGKFNSNEYVATDKGRQALKDSRS